MKKFLLLTGFALMSLKSQAQSYLILSNGITLTTDRSAFIYDFANFQLPYKVSHKGGNYFISDKKLKTIDSRGFLFEKSLKDSKLEKIKARGGNFFINDDYHLFTIDADGFVYQYENDDKGFKRAFLFGGNYFVSRSDDRRSIPELYTINHKGNYFKISLDGLNPADIIAFPGNYFQTKAGETFTISKEGFVFGKSEIKVAHIIKGGGNYLIDANNLLYTVSEQGHLLLPSLPLHLKISELKSFGANYMIDGEGRIFIVDKDGSIIERSTDHDLRNSKILSL
jgi:hypothetical protein